MKETVGLAFVAVFALFFVTTPVFAEIHDDKHSIAFVQAGDAISIGKSVKNPTNQTVNASIEFVFENIVGNNYWDTKQHSGMATANKSFTTHQDYFIDDVGRFFISIVSKIDGNVIKTSKTDFIVFEEYSDAALNGCDVSHKMLIKPDYSKAVCVFDDSIGKLLERGWVGPTTAS